MILVGMGHLLSLCEQGQKKRKWHYEPMMLREHHKCQLLHQPLESLIEWGGSEGGGAYERLAKFSQ